MSDERAKRTAAILARATDSLGMDVLVDTQDTDSEDVPTVVLMHDGDVTYTIEVPKDEDDSYRIGYGGGRGPNTWHEPLDELPSGNVAIQMLLRRRFGRRIEGHVQDAIRWWDRRTERQKEEMT